MKYFITLCSSAFLMLFFVHTNIKAEVDEDFTKYWKEFKKALSNEDTDALLQMTWDQVIVIEGESSYTMETKSSIINNDDSFLYEFYDDLLNLKPADFKKTTISGKGYMIESDHEEYIEEEEEEEEEELEEIEEPEGYEENEITEEINESENFNLAAEFPDNSVVYFATWKSEDGDGSIFNISFDFVKHNGKYYLFHISVIY